MKKTLILILLSIASRNSFADTYYFAWDGIGISTRHNYNAAQSYGSYQYKGIANGLATGSMEIFQQYNISYDQERGASSGTGVRYNVQFRFISPMVVTQLSKSGNVQFYMTAGAGDLQSGTATVHKWSRLSWSQGGVYDSTLDKSGDVNAYAIRLGFGFTEFYPLGGNFHLFFNQDFGWVVTPLFDITDNAYNGMKTNVPHLFEPNTISLRIGIAFITHSRNSKTPYKIYYKEDF